MIQVLRACLGTPRPTADDEEAPDAAFDFKTLEVIAAGPNGDVSLDISKEEEVWIMPWHSSLPIAPAARAADARRSCLPGMLNTKIP